MNRGALGIGLVGAAVLVGAVALIRKPLDPPAPVTAATQAVQVAGRIDLAPGNGPAPQGATVVVYAFAAEGSQQTPLAVWHRPASALPLEFQLDDSLAKDAALRLSAARQLVIGARLGQGTEALAQVGDWLANSQTVAPGARGVQLLLQPPPK